MVRPDDTRRVLVDNIEGMASVRPGEGGRDDVEFGVVDPDAEVAFGFGLRFGFVLETEFEPPAEKFLPPTPVPP